RWRLARQVRKTLDDADCALPIRTRELHIVHDAEQQRRADPHRAQVS
ncbi:TPA: mechanosensitive ion channel family protein, partial [Burkholderia vietnamiensis]|nr:mechanosensitive ion channel family protein [Burkholderia vietnamiensis]